MHTEEDSLTLLHTITGSWNAGCNCPASAGDSQQCLRLLFHGRVTGSSFPCALLAGPALAGPCPPAGECPELMVESVQSRISKSSFTACFRQCTLSSGSHVISHASSIWDKQLKVKSRGWESDSIGPALVHSLSYLELGRLLNLSVRIFIFNLHQEGDGKE